MATQFPAWAGLPVVAVSGGWDNATFRLGDELTVRLPSAGAYVAQVEKEHRWLPFLAAHLPMPIPEPVALGRPADDFSRSWSIYRWIDGEPASEAPITDSTQFAGDLARFLSALYAIDPSDGPPPGPHNFFRGGPLDTYDAQVREAIEVLTGTIDVDATLETWEAALATRWDRPPVWVHGDVAPSNLLVADGRLHAVIDFGCTAVGDPACDLVMAWTFFEGDSREAFRRGLPIDDVTWARGRGWALWKALITVVEGEDPRRRFGWRRGAAEVVDVVVADHRCST